MGVEQSKPKRKLAEIDREVTLIRSGLRASNRSYSKDAKNNIQENLVKYSNEVSDLKGKIKDRQLDHIQKNISVTMREVLTMDSDLDKAAIETDSIVQVPQNRKSASLDRPKNVMKTKNKSKSMPSLTNTPNLQDIDNKLKTLKTQIKVALESEDSTQLRVYQQTLKVLATSLELIDVPEYTPIGDKKKRLETILTAQYQTINKAIRDIRRTRDIKYLSNLKQKEDIMKELEIIRREIDKFDSLSREALKAGDNATIRDVQHNLKQIRQRLTSVESVDENTKTLKLQMKDKIAWLGKLITESALKGSQPDLTKAQSDYEEIIKNIASGKSENDVKEKLESLQNFTSSIGSLDEEHVKKKKQLLSNIDESLITLHGRESSNRGGTVDNGAQNSSYERKMLNNFMGMWQILNQALQQSHLSKEMYSEVENALNEVQNSIWNARKTLGNQHQQNTAMESSVPMVNNKSTILPTNINQDPKNDKLTASGDDLFQVRHSEKPRKEETRFSRINEIKTHVNYIKEKFESSIQKPNLKTKLEDYIRTLEEYIKSDNEVIANSAQILLIDICDIIKNIDAAMSTSNEKLSIDYYTDTISRIEENVTKLERTAKHFQADRNDTGYQDTKRLLNEVKEYLDTLDIPTEYANAITQKQRVSGKIEQIITQCERESYKREEAYVKEVKKTLDSLKDRVNRFTGPYKGVLYNAIEKDLNKILIDTDANVTDKFVSDEIIKDTERYLKILEHRALKDQSFRQPKKQEDNDKMSSLKEELQSIRNDIDTTPMNAINVFIGLNSRLDLLKLSLDQLKNLDENIEHQREIIYNEIETLKNVVEAKIALGQQDINQTSLEEFKKKATEENNRRMTEELDKIELTFGKLKEDIMNFIGTKSDKKYYELDESTMRLIVKMDDLKLPKGTILYERKVNLLKEIHQYEDLLEKRTHETEHITQFESDITDIENNFSRYAKSVKDLDNLSARIDRLKGHLESTKCNRNLQERKTSCLEKMEEIETRIRAKVNENILFEENLLQIKYSLEVLKKNINKEDVSVKDMTNKLSSIKTELLDMKDLNAVNLQQRTNLLKELEAIETSLVTKESKSNKSATNSPLENSRKAKSKYDKDIIEIEQTMKLLKNEIEIFIGTTKDGKFCELDEGINKLIMKLDDMKISEDNVHHGKKVKLLRELNQYSELLDKRAEDNEALLEYEHILSNIRQEGSRFSVSFINGIVSKLEKFDVVKDFDERKSVCLQNFNKLLAKQNIEKNLTHLTLFEKMFEELETQVDNFTGTPSDNSFNDVDSNLQKLLTEVQKIQFSPDDENNERKHSLLENIESSKSFLENKARESKIYQDFKKQLDDIKNKIDSTTTRDAIIKMHNGLKFTQSDIEKAPLKEGMKNDLHRKCTLLLQSYSDKINSLPVTNYIGSVDFIKDLERQSAEKSSPKPATDEIENFTKEIAELENKVDEFNGNEHSDEFKHLEDTLLKLNVRIKKHKDLNKIENNKRKVELKDRVVNCLTGLDEKVQDFENLEEVEKEVDTITAKLTNKSNQKDRDNIDEQLISLQLKLGKLNNLNKSLSEKKNVILQKIVGLMNKIKQMSLNSNSDSGTSI